MSRPVIGSKYTGPPFDRPCLRKLPAGWKLETAPTRGRIDWHGIGELCRWGLWVAAILIALTAIMGAFR